MSSQTLSSGFGLVGGNSLVGSITDRVRSWVLGAFFCCCLRLCYSRGLSSVALAEPGALSNALAGRAPEECSRGKLQAPASWSCLRQPFLRAQECTESGNQCWSVLRVTLGGLGFISQSSVLDSIKGGFVIRRCPSFSARLHFPLQKMGLQNDLLWSYICLFAQVCGGWHGNFSHRAGGGSCKWLGSKGTANIPH